MATNYIKPGSSIDWVATVAVSSNDPVLVGEGLFAIAAQDAAIGDTIALHKEGVFSLNKAAVAVTQGMRLYWDAAASVVTPVGFGNTLIGYAAAAAGAGAATCWVALAKGPAGGSDPLAEAPADWLYAGKFRALFDATGGLAIGDHLFGPTFPDNSRIVNAYVDVGTTFTSAGDLATIALGFLVDDPGGIVAAIAINNGANPWDAGMRPTIQDTGAVAAVAQQLTAARQLVATVAVEALTAGVLAVHGDYVVGHA